MKVLLAGVGAVLLVLGLALGLTPHSVPRMTVSPLSCGSAWAPDSSEAESQDEIIDALVYSRYRLGISSDYAEQCEAELGSVGTVAAVLAIFGSLVLVGVGFLIAAEAGARKTGPGGSEAGVESTVGGPPNIP